MLMEQQCALREHGYSLFEQDQMTAEERAFAVKWIHDQNEKSQQQSRKSSPGQYRNELPPAITQRLSS